ncbi:hypothetical protein B0H19DRAFT_1062822 [Mycena capillaripes]|nr:hypothetical protein B0H19DRAFT_1062822 [Mycena capillaripes]
MSGRGANSVRAPARHVPVPRREEVIGCCGEGGAAVHGEHDAAETSVWLSVPSVVTEKPRPHAGRSASTRVLDGETNNCVAQPHSDVLPCRTREGDTVHTQRQRRHAKEPVEEPPLRGYGGRSARLRSEGACVGNLREKEGISMWQTRRKLRGTESDAALTGSERHLL